MSGGGFGHIDVAEVGLAVAVDQGGSSGNIPQVMLPLHWDEDCRGAGTEIVMGCLL